jgi:hypothetical protein
VSGRVPPSSRANKRGPADTARQKAALLYERFTGENAEVIAEIDVPPLPSHVAVIGECDAVCYTAMRDGKLQSFIHDFAHKDKPLLCVSPDGKQLLLVGGRYRFTSRGIVDASDRKNRHVR